MPLNHKGVLCESKLFPAFKVKTGQLMSQCLGQEIFVERFQSTKRFSRNTNIAAISLFWDTNMAEVTSCENAMLMQIRETSIKSSWCSPRPL